MVTEKECVRERGREKEGREGGGSGREIRGGGGREGGREVLIWREIVGRHASSHSFVQSSRSKSTCIFVCHRVLHHAATLARIVPHGHLQPSYRCSVVSPC